MTNGEKIQTILDVDRDCTEVNGKNGIMTFSVSQNWWNAEYKEPSSSGKPNKSIEEKCPCYYCEHFEIKGLSHCKIHEEAYGDSRCNDYHKINQKLNKSEIPTDSNNKSEILVHLDVYKQVAKERDIAIEQLHELGYEFGQKIEPTTKNDLGVDCNNCKNNFHRGDGTSYCATGDGMCHYECEETILDKIREEIEKQEKWLLQAGYNAYNVDIAFNSVKSVLAESEDT